MVPPDLANLRRDRATCRLLHARWCVPYYACYTASGDCLLAAVSAAAGVRGTRRLCSPHFARPGLPFWRTWKNLREEDTSLLLTSALVILYVRVLCLPAHRARVTATRSLPFNAPLLVRLNDAFRAYADASLPLRKI